MLNILAKTGFAVAMLTGVTVGAAPAYAEGDVEKGEKVFRKCKACHDASEAAKNKVGPALWGVMGRDIASVESYTKYSDALQSIEGNWDEEKLAAFLTAPKDWVKEQSDGGKTKMAFRGVKEKDLADIVAYLGSLQ